MTFTEKIALWPILPFGMEGEDDDSNTDDGNDDTQNENKDAGKENSSKNKEQEDDEDDQYKGMSSKELKRLLADKDGKLKSTETELDSTKKTLTAKEREELDEIDRLKAEKEDDANTISNLRATNAKLAIIGAIRDDSRFEWHNPEIVAQQFKTDEIKVKEDGTVEGIAKALARIAKDHDYLLKGSKKKEDKDETKNQGPTGFQPGQGGANNGGNVDPDRAKLVEMMPALASRM